jgi:hypothetical protein
MIHKAHRQDGDATVRRLVERRFFTGGALASGFFIQDFIRINPRLPRRLVTAKPCA